MRRRQHEKREKKNEKINKKKNIYFTKFKLLTMYFLDHLFLDNSLLNLVLNVELAN